MELLIEICGDYQFLIRFTPPKCNVFEFITDKEK